MSVDYIDSNKTQFVRRMGVKAYINPNVNVALLSDGRIYNEENGRVADPNELGLYHLVYLGDNGKRAPQSVSFKSLVNSMLGLNKAYGKTLLMVNPRFGWVKNNIVAVPTHLTRAINAGNYSRLRIKVNDEIESRRTIRRLKSMGYVYDGCALDNYINTDVNGMITEGLSAKGKLTHLRESELSALYYYCKALK